jgi:predicted  nucleic acid-binding Zn-ribbon protein
VEGAAKHSMELTKSERAKITDSVHSIQSARASLSGVDESKVPKLEEIEECLDGADKTLRGALRESSPNRKST